MLRHPLVWIIAAVIVGWFWLKPPSAAELVKKGEALHLKGEYAEAVELYMRALKKDPDYMPAHLMLGFSYYRLSEREPAIIHFKAGLPHFDPNCDYARQARDRLRELEGPISPTR